MGQDLREMASQQIGQDSFASSSTLLLSLPFAISFNISYSKETAFAVLSRYSCHWLLILILPYYITTPQLYS